MQTDRPLLGAHGTLAALNVGRVRTGPGYPAIGSAIDKRPVEGRVRLTVAGVDGDTQADQRVHGGADQAVYAYAVEDLRWWAGQLAAELTSGPHPGQFGENLTTIGADVTGAVVGERWRVGTAELQVSSPRIPCQTFAGWMGVRGWVKRFTDAGRPGAYLRVVVDGECGMGDDIVVLSRPAHGVTIADVFAATMGDPSLLPRVVAAPELPERLRAKLAARLPAG